MNVVDFLSDHTYRMVFFGSAAIGLVAGALGCFAYLRKQSLMSDVISHAALPGTLLAFLFSVVVLSVDGRNMVALLVGAIVVGTAAVMLANTITTHSKIKIDTAMAVSLTMFFGVGLLLMRVIANGAFPGKGGIQDYLFGNASVLTIGDLVTSVTVGALAIVAMIVFWKEFVIRTFDAEYASSLGLRGRTIDTLMFMTIVISTVIGTKAVGLVLMVAFVITPPAAARQWTRSLPAMVLLSAAIGAIGSGTGAYLSVALGPVPTGPLIVLALFAVLLFSLLFAPRRSIIVRAVSRLKARNELAAALRQAEVSA